MNWKKSAQSIPYLLRNMKTITGAQKSA